MSQVHSSFSLDQTDRQIDERGRGSENARAPFLTHPFEGGFGGGGGGAAAAVKARKQPARRKAEIATEFISNSYGPITEICSVLEGF